MISSDPAIRPATLLHVRCVRHFCEKVLIAHYANTSGSVAIG